jgi:hypothetical protein
MLLVEKVALIFVFHFFGLWVTDEVVDGVSHPVGFISHCGDDVPALLLQGKNDVRQPGGLVQLDGLPTGDGLRSIARALGWSVGGR